MRSQIKDLTHRYTQTEGTVFLTGTQALTRLPMLQHALDQRAGHNTAGFISGYRGSPLGGFDKSLWDAASHLAEHNIHFQPGVNEDLAATAVWGTQQVNLFAGARYDGVFSMWYGKGPGVDRCGDVFRHANHAGTSPLGGVLVVAGDDHGCKSSTLPHQTEYAFVDAMIPVLYPAGVQEIIDLGLLGWALSRYSGCWVALKTIAETVDASLSVDVSLDRHNIVAPTNEDSRHARWPDAPLEQELRLHGPVMAAVHQFARANRLDRVVIEPERPRLGIISAGKSWLDVRQALQDLGIDDDLAREIGLRLYKVSMPWPLEPEGIASFAEGLDEILVVEEKRGLIEDQLTSQLYHWQHEKRPVVVGKHDERGAPLLPSTGELSPAVIARAIARRLQQFINTEPMMRRLQFLQEKEVWLKAPRNVATRTPHFCSGCPHNTSTVVPEGSRAMGGIGCHYMATWMDRQTDTFTQMGGEGATWIGQAPFTETQHVFQNLGDGTYFHSGLLAIRASVAAGVNITYKLLYNDAVAMTGGQPVDGPLGVEQICDQIRAEGVDRIAVVSDDINKYSRASFPHGTTFNHRDDLQEVQESLRECLGTSVLVYDQTCAAEKRRRRKRGTLPRAEAFVMINEDVCEGCGDCSVQSNCLAVVPVETPFGRKRQIDQTACNQDLSCLKGYCPSFVTVTGERRKPKVVSVDPSALPAPEQPSIASTWNLVIAGVGGTGVTTLGAILGMAAQLDGHAASLLDMTGLAQKFGAVVSHLRVGDKAEDLLAARIPAGEASIVLGCDLVVAASNDCLVKVGDDTVAAFINSHEAMTAEFTRDANAVLPVADMKSQIEASLSKGTTRFVDTSRIALEHFGDATPANVILAGMACQKGHVPISIESIEQAIRLNGTAVEINLAAFRLGRELALKPDTTNPVTPALQQASLHDTVKRYGSALVEYQDERYAERFTSLVEHVRLACERHGHDEALSLAVAHSYYRLLAYKDEYEVARLHTRDNFRQAIREQFGAAARSSFHFAPGWLKRPGATGRPRKVTLPGWLVTPGLRLLSQLRFLRGTRLDPFGYTADRKLERDLIAEFESMVNDLVGRLDDIDYTTAVRMVALPATIRGYGPVKEREADRVRRELSVLQERLQPQVEPVRIVDPAQT